MKEDPVKMLIDKLQSDWDIASGCGWSFERWVIEKLAEHVAGGKFWESIPGKTREVPTRKDGMV